LVSVLDQIKASLFGSEASDPDHDSQKHSQSNHPAQEKAVLSGSATSSAIPDQSVAEDAIVWQERPKPTIGLALGGGSARGWAHIGVMHALDELGIKPDIVAGTSIGAVVGGAYVAGKMDKIEAFARALSPRRILGLLDPIWGGPGLISGHKLQKLLEQELGDLSNDDLPVRMIAVATELATGHEIWLRRGPLAEAMRASYALPGIFKPVQVNQRWLVDGALVNPVPVSVCRAYGARVVIAINLGADYAARGTALPDLEEFDIHPEETLSSLKKPSRLASRIWSPHGIPAVMMQAYNIIQDRMTRSRLAGDPPDIMISPLMKDISLFDFHKADQAIQAGYEATLRSVESLQQTLDLFS
jgi:NTE family protein